MIPNTSKKTYLTALLILMAGWLGAVENPDFIIHRILSPYQADSTTIRVLLPDDFDEGKSYRVLYVLPAAQQGNYRFGDGLLQIAKHGFHNRHQLICVAPEFIQMSWYLDHGRNPEQQDEKHFLEKVIPYIDGHYPTLSKRKGRLLIGFSKSGWGAFSLLLRHPEMFDKAAGWDLGIRIDTGPMSEEEKAERIHNLFGDIETFEKYRISNLLKERGAKLGERERLFYYNTGGRRGPGGAEIHRLMVELDIPHRYVYEKHRTHRWDSGWIPEAVKFLVED